LQNCYLARYPSVRYFIPQGQFDSCASVVSAAAAMGHEIDMMTKSSNIVDVYVGARLRMRRTMLGMSQSRLGELLGVTFQQIQKYEKGSNRISASRLQHTSRVLEVAPGYFFEGAPADSAEPGFAEESPQSYVVDFLASTEGLQLNRAFLRVRDPKVRRRIVDLVISLASPEEEAADRRESVLDDPAPVR
jgi:transcriptional regulator with XRE-family HTH domain